MLHGLNFSKLVLLSTLFFTCSNASHSQLLQYHGTCAAGVRRTANQTDSAGVTCSKSCGRTIKGKSQKN